MKSKETKPITQEDLRNLFDEVIEFSSKYNTLAFAVRQFANAVCEVPLSVMNEDRSKFITEVKHNLKEMHDFKQAHQDRVLNNVTGLGIDAESEEAKALFNELELDRFGAWIALRAVEEHKPHWL